MNDQGQIRTLAQGEPLKVGEVEISGGMAQELAGLSNKARKEFYKAIRQGRSPGFAISAALSVDGVLVREPPR